METRLFKVIRNQIISINEQHQVKELNDVFFSIVSTLLKQCIFRFIYDFFYKCYVNTHLFILIRLIRINLQNDF